MPIVYLLCGLPGSGKTTYAKELETQGVIRLTLDEELFKRHGRHLPEGTYSEYEKKTKDALTEELVQHLKQNRSVVLDWGFWKREDRDRIAQLVRDNGGEPKLLYFKRDLNELASRVQNRDLSKNHEIDTQMLADFSAQFEEPNGEGEVIV